MALLLLLVAWLVAACSRADPPGAGSEEKPSSEAVSEDATTTVDAKDVEEGDARREVDLEEVNDSGISGSVTIEATESGEVKFSLTLDKTDGTFGAEARIGDCTKAGEDGLLGDATSYTLPDVEDGFMGATVELPEELLKEGSYSLVVHEDDTLDSDPAACAQVEVE